MHQKMKQFPERSVFGPQNYRSGWIGHFGTVPDEKQDSWPNLSHIQYHYFFGTMTSKVCILEVHLMRELQVIEMHENTKACAQVLHFYKRSHWSQKHVILPSVQLWSICAWKHANHCPSFQMWKKRWKTYVIESRKLASFSLNLDALCFKKFANGHSLRSIIM